MASDRVTRMMRVLLVLMFAELVIVILLVDYRLDAVETQYQGAARGSRSPHGSRDGALLHERPQGAELELTADLPAPTAGGSSPAPEGWARLSDDDRRAVIEELYRAERVWRRTAGVLEGLSALRKRDMMRELDRTERARIAEMTRDYAGRRVRMELDVMASDLPDMDALRADLGGFDTAEAERIESELSSFLNPAEAKQVARVVVPRAP